VGLQNQIVYIVLKAKKSPTRKAKRKQQRLEKKRHRIAYQISKAEKIVAEDTEVLNKVVFVMSCTMHESKELISAMGTMISWSCIFPPRVKCMGESL